MDNLVYFRRLNRISLLVLLLSVLAVNNIWGQTAAPAGSLKLYIEENGRLKQQKTALTAENSALKQALQTEKQKSVQLQVDLDHVQPGILERDSQLADLRAKLSRADQKVAQQQLLAVLLAWTIVLLLLGLLAYSQRVALRRQLRRLMEWRTAHVTVAGKQTSQQQVRATRRIDENAIRPEELFERLYGRR